MFLPVVLGNLSQNLVVGQPFENAVHQGDGEIAESQDEQEGDDWRDFLFENIHRLFYQLPPPPPPKPPPEKPPPDKPLEPPEAEGLWAIVEVE